MPAIATLPTPDDDFERDFERDVDEAIRQAGGAREAVRGLILG